MQSLARSSGGLLRRPSAAVSVFSALPRWRRPALARRDDPALPNGNLNCLCWFACRTMLDSEVKSEKLSNHGCESKEVEPSNTMEEMQGAIMEGTRSLTEEVAKGNPTYTKRIWSPTILPKSSHRDGAIYKKELIQWKIDYFDIFTNRNETRLEPMRFSVATNCDPDPENCDHHWPYTMLQIFSLKLAKAHINNGPVLLYGYLAARDDLDSSLNYVFYRTRDDPIVVQQGSPIEMTGPKRGILLCVDVMFEFDMRIKIGEHEDDDLQLVDGIIELREIQMLDIPTTIRINGSSGVVDMPLVKICTGVEATVEVAVLEVHKGFDFSLSGVISVLDVPEEFQLFGGHIDEPCGLRRFVVAVFLDTVMHLKLKVDQKGANVAKHCSFLAKLHGSANHQIKFEAASVSVKVTWSPMRDE
ncbi:hypothetical protein ACP70R_047819 [Stipagrostis hirtigluma subsp. patula]